MLVPSALDWRWAKLARRVYNAIIKKVKHRIHSRRNDARRWRTGVLLAKWAWQLEARNRVLVHFRLTAARRWGMRVLLANWAWQLEEKNRVLARNFATRLLTL